MCRIMWRETPGILGSEWGDASPYVEMEFDDKNLFITAMSVFVPRSVQHFGAVSG